MPQMDVTYTCPECGKSSAAKARGNDFSRVRCGNADCGALLVIEVDASGEVVDAGPVEE